MRPTMRAYILLTMRPDTIDTCLSLIASATHLTPKSLRASYARAGVVHCAHMGLRERGLIGIVRGVSGDFRTRIS